MIIYGTIVLLILCSGVVGLTTYILYKINKECKIKKKKRLENISVIIASYLLLCAIFFILPIVQRDTNNSKNLSSKLKIVETKEKVFVIDTESSICREFIFTEKGALDFKVVEEFNIFGNKVSTNIKVR